MSSFINFLKDSYTEFKDRVEWPKWADLQSSTIVVTVATVLLAIFLLGIDSFFSKSIQSLIGLFISLFN